MHFLLQLQEFPADNLLVIGEGEEIELRAE